MSRSRSVGRLTATQVKVRSGSTKEKVRPASKSKKNRSTNLCAFTFADGRQCRTPRCSGHLHLCYFHAQKEAESLAAQQVGKDISRFLPTKLLTACDLGVAMSRLFCAVAQGQVKPKVATTLAYVAQTMLQSIPIAQDEYIHSFDTNAWRREIRSSFNVPAPQPGPAPHPASQPAQQPKSAPPPPTPVEARPVYPVHPEPRREPASSASSSSTSSPAPQPSAKPAPSPHTPLPPTGAEFAQQVLAGRNSSRSEIPTQPRPGREPRSSDSSSSPAPSSAPIAPASTSSTQPAPSSPSTPPTPNNSQPSPTPPARHPNSPNQSPTTQNSQHNYLPAPAPPAPPPVPPGFGAPANWDVLIPPKPRRRLSRHWHFLD